MKSPGDSYSTGSTTSDAMERHRGLGGGSPVVVGEALGHVVRIDPLTDSRWDRYVCAHPAGLVYHHSAWLRCLEREYGQEPLALAVERSSGELAGALPLLETRGFPIPGMRGVAGARLASLPRTPVAGPLADGRDELAMLLSAAVDLVRHRPGKQLQGKLGGPVPDGLVDGAISHPWRWTYVLELPDDSANLRFGSARKTRGLRSAINRARRAGIVIREAGSRAELDAWYVLYLETMRHHLVPARPLRLFQAMWEELRPRDLMKLLVAERQGEIVAGCVLLEFGDTVSYAFGGARRTSFAHHPNDLLHWHAINAAAQAGRRSYDFGEVVENHPLADFKRKWGTEPRRLYRYYFPAPAGAPDVGDGRALGAVLARLRPVWRKVPLPVTATVGDRVYRYL